MKKRPVSIVAAALVLTVAACGHDEGDTMLRLAHERLGDNTKMSIDGIVAEWSEGDTLWVNGATYAVSVDDDRARTLVPHAESYNALFPASIVTSSTSVTLPSEYHYTTDADGRQQLDLPMIATTNGTSLFFYHLTGALVVKYVNHKSEAVTVDRVTVSSGSYALCGTRTISFGDTTQTPTAGSDSVTVYFDRQATTLAAGDTLSVMVPVAPVGSDNIFTVTVSSHIDGNRYTVSNTQQSGHPLPRNALGYSYMVVDNSITNYALFRVTGNGAGRTMHISTALDFMLMQTAINNGWVTDGIRYSTLSYSIDADIDMSQIEIAPISGFTGSSFNGNGHTVDNLTIRSTSACCALFDTIRTSGTPIANIRLTNMRLESLGTETTRYISPLISRISVACTLSHCETSVTSIQTTSASTIYYGGIAAYVAGDPTINNCTSTTRCSLTSAGTLYFGGYVGRTENNVSCNSCSAHNNVALNSTNNIFAGGLIGDGKNKSHYVNSVTCTDTIDATTNTGNIYCGGLVGYLKKSTSNINGRDCTISGNISVNTNGTDTLYVGTLYGYGRRSGLYSGIVYDATNLTIPPSSGNINSGDPTGSH